ncbi:hypothetical protein [Streptomyces sp. enrichment culture]|uniref:SCO2102 family sporulation regulator n=1 Tax=Streptomyces sp. enrichment culture TaxID=1795815 RepID=UPI003F5455FF
MGWTVLYIAFGVVALWLLGEVLLQYKARLRWRLLAFAGFLGVVAGVLISSVVVIGLGACAFAVGQVYVTMSFRRGFAAGWAVKRPDSDGGSRRGRGAERRDPTLEVSDLEAADAHDAATDGYDGPAPAYGQDDDYDRDDVFTPARPLNDPSAAETTAVYEPQPLPEDTGSYGIYGDPSYASAEQPRQQPQDTYAAAAQSPDQTYGYDAYAGYGQQGYGYDGTGQQQYAAYSDPYIGTQTYGGDTSYDAGYGGQQQFAQQAYGQDQYSGGGYGETPPGGVWVPQQRTDEQYGAELPQDQGYYDGNGQARGTGYDEQYRY